MPYITAHGTLYILDIIILAEKFTYTNFSTEKICFSFQISYWFYFSAVFESLNGLSSATGTQKRCLNFSFIICHCCQNSKIYKGEKEAKLKIPRGEEGFKHKYPPWGRYGYFPEPHNKHHKGGSQIKVYQNTHDSVRH